MSRLFLAVIALLWALPAFAQLDPFKPSGYAVPPLAVTTAAPVATIPAGTQSVLVQNVGTTNAAYCEPDANASTSAVFLSAGGGAFIFNMNGSTQLSCATSTSTTTVNITPGSGYTLALSGGGGGGSGGGGSATNCGSAGFIGTFGCYVDVQTSATLYTILNTVNSSINTPILGPVNITEHDCSVTLTAGTTAQNAFAATATIHGFRIMNIDTTHVEDVWFSTTTTAAPNTIASYRLAASPAVGTSIQSAAYTTTFGEGVNTALSVVAATTGHLISCTYW